MMNGTGHWFTRGPGWTAADLRYAGEQLAMTVVLPDADRFTEIEHAINADWLGALVSGLRRGWSGSACRAGRSAAKST